MEGHRGEPRNKPPFPGNYGLHGRPTLINSVETFADVPVILQRGADWWAEQGDGRLASAGSSSPCPATSRTPASTACRWAPRSRELIDLAGGVLGGAAVGAVQPGGASSNFIGPDQLDLALDFGTLAEAGHHARLRRAGGARRGHRPAGRVDERAALLPQRVVRQVRALPGRLHQGPRRCCAARWTRARALDDARRGRILQLEETMRKTSICGLGQVALGPVVSVLGLTRAARRPGRSPGRRPTSSRTVSGKEFFTARTVAEARAGFRPRAARQSSASRSPRRCTGCPPRTSRRRRAARLRPFHRGRLRRPGGRHLRRLRRAAVLPRPARRGADGRRTHRGGPARRLRRDADRGSAPAPAPTRWSWSSTPRRRCRARSR